MFKHYFVTALRSAKKDTVGFFINLLGLITGFVVFSFAFAFVSYEKNYDTFWENSDRIVKLGSNLVPESPYGRPQISSHYSGILDHLDEFPDVVSGGQIYSTEWPVTVENESFPAKLSLATPGFFDVFKFNFIEGNPDNFATHSDSALLSRREAIKYFGSPAKAMGKIVRVNRTKDFQIVGVFENIPLNSHLVSNRNNGAEFNLVITYLSKDEIRNKFPWGSWQYLSNGLYFKVKQSTNLSDLEEQLTNFSNQHKTGWTSDVYASSTLTKIKSHNTSRWDGQNILIVTQSIGSLILLIAVFNAISMSSTRMISRSGELAIRRILGASRKNLITQFIAENLVLTFTALGISILLLFGLNEDISSLIDRQLDMGAMLNGNMLMLLIAVAITVAIFSTTYPIYLLTKTANGSSLVISAKQSRGSSWLRQGLACIQFSMVTTLIFSVVIMANQNQFLRDSAAKIDGDRIITITGLHLKDARENSDLIESRLKKLPGVTMVSRSSMPPFRGSMNMIPMILPNAQSGEKAQMDRFIFSDPNYMPLHEIKIITGRNLSIERSDDDSTPPEKAKDETKELNNTYLGNALVNQSMAKKMGFSTHEGALGSNIIINEKTRDYLTVVGVVEDKQMYYVGEGNFPVMFRWQKGVGAAFSVRYASSADINLDAIKATWSDVLPGEKIATQTINALKDENMKRRDHQYNLTKVVALIALILASSGLYVITAHLAKSSVKEVGIRKVMGAKDSEIIRLFIIRFSKPIMLALFIGIPMGSYLMENYYLNTATIRIDVDLSMVLTAGGVTLAIGLSTIFIHILRAARTRPIEVLHHD